MDAEQAAEALSEAGEVRRLTRQMIRAYSFPFFLYGTAALLAGGIAMVAPGATGWWWMGAGLAGGMLTWRHYAIRAQSTGVCYSWHRYALAWGLAGAGIGVAVALSPPVWRPSLAWAVIGVSYAALGVTGDGPQMTLMGACLCVVGLAPLLGLQAQAPTDALAGVLLLAGGAASLALAQGRGPGWARR